MPRTGKKARLAVAAVLAATASPEPSPLKANQRTNGPVNAHLSLLHIPINMFEYYGI